jgi:hypothetical protein
MEHIHPNCSDMKDDQTGAKGRMPICEEENDVQTADPSTGK